MKRYSPSTFSRAQGVLRKNARLDLPFSMLLDTLFLPFTVAAELGVNLGVQGGL